MLFLDHSSPRPGHLPESWLMENSPLFSPTAQPPFSHSHNTAQSPLMKRSKRRLSDDFQSYKKSCSNERPSSGGSNDWPVFEHPGGGVIQQSPYGNIRVVKVGNAEVSTIEKNVPIDFYAKMHETKSIETKEQESLRGNGHHSRLVTPDIPPSSQPMKISPSPSAEVEGYMLEGYRDINKSYTVHQEEILNVNYSLYDQSHEDAHLDQEEYDPTHGYLDGVNDDYEMAL